MGSGLLDRLAAGVVAGRVASAWAALRAKAAAAIAREDEAACGRPRLGADRGAGVLARRREVRGPERQRHARAIAGLP